MKFKTTTKPVPSFAPRSLEIVFESQDELDRFGALFNLVPVADALEEDSEFKSSDLRRAISELGGDCSARHDALGNDIKARFRNWRAD